MQIENLSTIINEVRGCRLCQKDLPEGPRPVIQISRTAKILIAGQAPGRKVHQTGVPFDDPSGERLRKWMGIDADVFYDENKIAIMPMGFCYPGTGASGDLPPLKKCAEHWRHRLLSQIENIQFTLVIGQYAMDWHMGERKKKTLTETVKSWSDYFGDGIIPLPHPSPRNNIWIKKNPWFEKNVIPQLQKEIAQLVS